MLSKKKIFALICIFVLMSWGIVSAYYYKQHIVTVKEHKIGEIIEVSEGIVMLHNIEIHDFEQNYYFHSDKFKWFYDSVLPKIPEKLHIPAMKIMAFYNKPYNFELSYSNIEANRMNVKGIYIFNDGKEEDRYDDINITVYTEDGTPLNAGSKSSTGTERSNIRLFNFHRLFLDQYIPMDSDVLIITVTDKLTNESKDINIKADWETKKYNFFNPPPREFNFSPEDAVSRLIRAVVYEEDLKVAKEMIHPKINNFPWENLKHDQWSKEYKIIIHYEGDYLGFSDVFLANLTFGGSEGKETEEVFEQKIYLINHDDQWEIIDATHVT